MSTNAQTVSATKKKTVKYTQHINTGLPGIKSLELDLSPVPLRATELALLA